MRLKAETPAGVGKAKLHGAASVHGEGRAVHRLDEEELEVEPRVALGLPSLLGEDELQLVAGA